jgi:hypothetical protein
MSVPLDRLYDYLYGLCNHNDILIYRWYPHGSRKREHCQWVEDDIKTLTFFDRITRPYLVCHDQEPLNFALYQTIPKSTLHDLVDSRYLAYDRVLLLHSEKRSLELAKFEQDDAIGVYYWGHAMIARDWFRYAEHDQRLAKSAPKKDFLVYNRAWSGTREYRLKFAEMIVDNALDLHCHMNFSINDGLPYTHHQFKNSNLKIARTDLEQFFIANEAKSCFSADYTTQDYRQTRIEIVLETLFDDTRWHLTEKVLRPIACGKPFILAATPGSLDYLRSYGFQTFGQWIDESYDNIVDPRERLIAVVKEMKKFANLSPEEKQQMCQQMQAVCDHNRAHFFSDDFLNQVLGEFTTNLDRALTISKQQCSARWLKVVLRSAGSVERFVNRDPDGATREDLVKFWRWFQARDAK